MVDGLECWARGLQTRLDLYITARHVLADTTDRGEARVSYSYSDAVLSVSYLACLPGWLGARRGCIRAIQTEPVDKTRN